MRIVVDAFGGDNAPLEILRGAADAIAEYGFDILLCGDEKTIRTVAEENEISLAGMEIAHAPDVIGMEEDPTEIMKSKNNSSLAEALRRLAAGEGDAFVSAGSTGAVLVGSTFIVKRIKGIRRCALAPIMPTTNGHYLLIDCGANVECRAEMLLQFGIMGSIYMEKVIGIANPRVGLANVGVEETKGAPLQLEAFSLLKDSGLNFVGNVEAREFPFGACDVLVTDGFTGNIIVKLTEGMGGFALEKLKSIFYGSTKGKLAAGMVMKDLKELKKVISTEEYGGAPLLGIAKPILKAHGNSNAYAFKNAIRMASNIARSGMVDIIAANTMVKESQ